MTRNRVVITGIGVLAPNGTNLETFWRSIVAGESGIDEITLFDPTDFKSRIAGEIKNFDPLEHMNPDWKPRRMARHTQLAYVAAQMALRDAHLDPKLEKPGAVLPICVGVSTSAMDVLERGFRELQERGPRGVNPGVVQNCQPQAVAHVIAEKLGVETETVTVSSACPSGIDAIASAASRIRSGEVDVAIAGGADSHITPLAMASFASAGLSSFANDDPQRASRPYDATSDSGVISEGACVVIVENLDRALARGIAPYLEITGYSSQSDHDPDEPCSGLEFTMRLALANASRDIRDIDYICSYGPGHPALDAAEVKMIRRVFGLLAERVPVSSIKGVTGNPLAAAGPFQLACCALAFKHNLIPPTANHETPNFGCDLDFVPKTARKAQLRCALVNVRGLGGGNSSMVVERIPDDIVELTMAAMPGQSLSSLS
ncbi:MAG TPA: beta-ketoacyl-[acyl-carrier-protein] synthase family protein [Chthoniobacterales bacterium]